MKKLLLTLLISFIALPLWAQESSDEIDTDTLPPPLTSSAAVEKPKVNRLENWNVGLSFLQWNEELRMRQFGVTSYGSANFNGYMVSAQKDYTYLRGGYSFAGYFGAGKANGGNSTVTVTYDENRLPYTMFGASGRLFYRLSGRINFGTTFMIFTRQITYPDSNGVSAESGKNPNYSLLADLNLRLGKSWELYQGIGTLGESATIWRVGVNFRL